MRVEVKGKFDGFYEMQESCSKAIQPFFDKLAEDNPEMWTNIAEGDVCISEASIVLQFQSDKQQEPTVLTVDHHGTPEMLVIKAEFDEDGNMLEQSDNEQESEFTEAEALIAQGLPTDFTAVESNYYSDQLFEMDEYQIKDMTVALFHTGDLSEESGIVVVQYQQDNKLIQEIEVPWREYEKVQTYFQELAG